MNQTLRTGKNAPASAVARSPNGPFALVLAATVMTACSPGEDGVSQGRTNEPIIALSEGACLGTCPVYDMTLHDDGAYTLNGEKFVRTTGVSEGRLKQEAWSAAEKALASANFWTLQPTQTARTLSHCQSDAPTVKITWRTKEGKEKTVAYDAGCGVEKMQTLVQRLRAAMSFDLLVWTNEKFDYAPPPR